LENQVAEHHRPKTRADLLDAGSRTDDRKSKQADGAQDEKAVDHAEGANLLFNLAGSKHVAEESKKHVQEIHVNQLPSKELPQKEVIHDQLGDACKDGDHSRESHGNALQEHTRD